jgi:hypothetical protein
MRKIFVVTEKGRTTMRLIDADALKEEVSSLRMVIPGLRCGKGVLSDYAREYLKSILRIIDESPTIDAEPLVTVEVKP